jgi:PAS domain S-box-containing protein
VPSSPPLDHGVPAQREPRRVATALDERAEEALPERERESRLIVDSIPGLVAVLTPSGEMDSVNSRVVEYCGRPMEELRQWATNDTVHPEDLPRVSKLFARLITSGEPSEWEARLRRFDGVYRWFQLRGHPLRETSGRIVRWYLLLTDIDDRKRAEVELRRVYDSFADAERLSKTGNFTTDIVADEHIWSAELYRIFEIDPVTRITVQAVRDLIHPEDLPSFDAGFARSLGGTDFDLVFRIVTRSGNVKHLHSVARLIERVEGRPLLIGAIQDVTESKVAEQALRERERESRLIADTIPGLVAMLTPSGEVESVNHQLVEYCGQPLEAMKQWATNGTVHSEDLPRVGQVFAQAIASGEPYDFEARIRRFDGVYRWFQVRGLPLRDTSEHIVRWYVLLTDIDDRKRAEDATRASERNLKLIIDTIPALAWSARPDGTPEFLNQRCLDFIGLLPEQVRDWDWTAAVHPDDLSGLGAWWQGVMASQATGETEARLRRHDDEYRWFLMRANPLRDEKGGVVKWYGINTDIEDRKRAEDGLRRNEAFLAEGQRLTSTGFFSWRLDTDEITLSDGLRRMYEVRENEAPTMERLFGLIHPEDIPMLAKKQEQIRADNAPFEHDLRLRMPDGRVKYLRSFGRVIRREDGRLESVGATQDMTERRAAEEALDKLRSELARASRVMTLGALTASIAHEINQPLSGIITNASTCLRTLDADPPNVDVARETARRIIRDGNRASEVITRLRALFTKKEFTLESLDLNEATREVISLSLIDLQRNRSELADDLPRVTGDRVQLQQVVLNLLRNASDAMAGVDDRPRQLLVRTERDNGDRVRVTVRDAGVGVDRQSMEKLFDAFYTTKSGGMGIGLSVSRSIVDRHQGRLWVEPNEGPGATFAFSIPCGR